MIRLKNTKTYKIEYFRDPGVTWLQIIYLEAFYCVDVFPYVSLFLLYFSYLFHWFSLFFHYFSLLFIVFQLFNLILLSFDKAQKYENGQDIIFSRPWRDIAPNYIYIYIFRSLPLRGFFSVCFIVFVVFFIFLAYQIKPTILLGKSQNIQTCFHHLCVKTAN